MRIQFDDQTRKGLHVAYAIAEEIENNVSKGENFCTRKDHESRPGLLSIQNNTFRFEGGIVVKPNLINLSDFNQCRRQETDEWVVTHCQVRFYELDENYDKKSNKKTEETWSHQKLQELNNARPWYKPHVHPLEEIKGRVCVFWDTGSAEGRLEVDPDYDRYLNFTSFDEVEYSRFIKGDLEQAQKKAQAILNKLLTQYKK